MWRGVVPVSALKYALRQRALAALENSRWHHRFRAGGHRARSGESRLDQGYPIPASILHVEPIRDKVALLTHRYQGGVICTLPRLA